MPEPLKNCPKCGTQARMAARFCGKCGYNFAAVATNRPAAASAAATRAPTSSPSIRPATLIATDTSGNASSSSVGRPCPSCGVNNRSHARFCQRCGASMNLSSPQMPALAPPPAAAPRVAPPIPPSAPVPSPAPLAGPCPGCGSTNRPGARFCLTCGRSLAAGGPPASMRGATPFAATQVPSAVPVARLAGAPGSDGPPFGTSDPSPGRYGSEGSAPGPSRRGSPMNAKVRDALCTIMAENGEEMLEQPKRLRGMLKDLVPGSNKEVLAILAAIEADVPRSLLQSARSRPPLATLTHRLMDRNGLSEEVASWAVESWAAALKGGSEAS